MEPSLCLYTWRIGRLAIEREHLQISVLIPTIEVVTQLLKKRLPRTSSSELSPMIAKHREQF